MKYAVEFRLLRSENSTLELSGVIENSRSKHPIPYDMNHVGVYPSHNPVLFIGMYEPDLPKEMQNENSGHVYMYRF